MASPTYDDIFEYARRVQSVSQEARDMFIIATQNIDFDDWTTAAEELRTVITQIVDYYGLASSELGAQWYEYCHELGTGRGYTAIVGETSRYSVRSDVNAVLDKMFDGAIDEHRALELLKGVVTDQVQKQARDTILSNLNDEYLEAKRLGSDTFAAQLGYARVPVGDTCAFCIMLASRGFVYASERSASQTRLGNKYHPNCNCTVVPFTQAHTIPGYEGLLEKYERMYRDADKARRSGNLPKELKKHIEVTRREHNERYMKGEASERWRSYNEITMIMRWQNEGLH